MSVVVLDTDVASSLLRGRVAVPFARMRAFLDGLVVLPYDQRVAAGWGELQAYAQRRGRPRPADDSWIAACCLVRELPLVTYDVKDFADFQAHEGLELIT